MSLSEIIAVSTGGLALVISLLSLALDARILRHQEHHHGLLSELHHHHIGRHQPTERLVDEQALIEMEWEDDR